MSESFKEGDVVRLKSHGPKMTVTDVDTQMRTIHCMWFAGATVCRDTFRPATLKRDDGNDIGGFIA